MKLTNSDSRHTWKSTHIALDVQMCLRNALISNFLFLLVGRIEFLEAEKEGFVLRNGPLVVIKFPFGSQSSDVVFAYDITNGVGGCVLARSRSKKEVPLRSWRLFWSSTHYTCNNSPPHPLKTKKHAKYQKRNQSNSSCFFKQLTFYTLFVKFIIHHLISLITSHCRGAIVILSARHVRNSIIAKASIIVIAQLIRICLTL